MATHTHQEELPTEVFDWGSIKWGVSTDTFSDASVTVGEVVINPTKGHDRHTHPESDEVLYVIQGKGVQTVGDSGEFPVSAGDCIYIPRGVEHSTFNDDWRQMRILAIYNPTGAEKALQEAPDHASLAAGSNPVWERRP